MKKILVVTDFSTSSRAALRFASQLATTNHFQLIFFHVHSEVQEASWKDSVDASFQDVAEEEMRGQLERFVRDTIGNNPNLERMFVISSGLSAVREIIKYAETNGVHYICASRSGLGRTTSLFGSTIESLIQNSTIPVIAVPEHYRRKPIVDITYVSDLLNVDREFKLVSSFATLVGAKVALLHFSIPLDYLLHSKEIEAIKRKSKRFHITLHLEAFDYERTFIKNMNAVIRNSRPSLIVMFTKPRIGIFEKMFLSSLSSEYALVASKPLLIFKKQELKSLVEP